MATRVTVLGKQRWDMVTENGERLTGSKIFVYDGEKANTQDKEGVFATTFNLPYERYNDFGTVPGVYDLDFALKVGSKGQFTVSGAEFVEDFEI